MMIYIDFTIICAALVILTGYGRACEGQCVNELSKDTCELINESKFRCVVETNFTESSIFNITSVVGKKLSQCSTTLVKEGTLNFECPYDQDYYLFPIDLKITALDSKTSISIGVSIPFKTNISKLLRPTKLSNIKIYASDNVGIRLQGDINQKYLQSYVKKSVYVTFSSVHNFHKPIHDCWIVRKQMNKTWEGLHPFEEYEVKIQWKLENGDYCSPVTCGTNRTQPTKPTAAPQILKGSYSDTIHNNKSALYWKPIAKYHENGPLVQYIIYKLPTHIMKNNYGLLHNFTSLIDLDNVSHYFNVSNLKQYQIATVAGSECSVILSNDIIPGDHIMIRSNNAVGSSDAYSSIEFTSKGTNVVQHFVVSQFNQTHYELSWTSQINTAFTVHLYWCYGLYWPLLGWTECKNNISEMSILSSKLERSESPFKLILTIPPDNLPQPIDKPSSTMPAASSLVAADDTLPPNHLQFGMSVQYEEQFAPIVWNTSATKLDRSSEKQNERALYIVIAVTAIVFLICICVCCKHYSKKKMLKSYEVTMPANFDECASENESPVSVSTSYSDRDTDKQRHDSGVGTLSISTPSSFSSPSSPQLDIPRSSTDTTRDKESESESSSASDSKPIFKTNSTSIINNQHRHWALDDGDTSDNYCDEDNYPPTTIVFLNNQ